MTDEKELLKIAERAKSYVRMLLLIKEAAKGTKTGKPNETARRWIQTHKGDIELFVAEMQKPHTEGEPYVIPQSIEQLFAKLPYAKKKKEAEARYMLYYEAWKDSGSKSKGVMLARYNTLVRVHNLTLKEDIETIRVALCDALSGYSATMNKLETSSWYLA
jgi:hypothetical protein